MTRKAFILSLSAFFMLWISSAVAAQPVQITVSVIHATGAAGGVDPALKPIEADLKSAFGQYSTFKRVGRQQYALTQGAVAKIALPSQNSEAELIYKGPAPKPGLHQVTFAVPSKQVKVDLRLPVRKVFYQAGLKHEDGILILAIYLKEK